MKRKFKILICLIIIVICLGIIFLYNYGPNFNLYLFPPSVEKYVSLAIDYMDNGINANTLKWDEMKSQAYEKSSQFKTYEDSYDLLEESIKVAGGKHSFIIRPEEIDEISQNNKNILPTTKQIENILYIKLPPIMLTSDEDNEKYINTINDAFNSNDYKGFIIDLSDNTGGDMWPMLSSVAPLIPDGKFLQFQDVSGKTDDFYIEDGKIVDSPISIDGTGQKIENASIAIIMNEMTGSSGEIVALAFKGLENVKYFGRESSGYTSVNSQKILFDGAMLQLTTGKIIDRTGEEYLNKKITPDVYSDRPIEDALKWLKEENNGDKG